MATEPPDSSSNRAANTAHPNDVAINQAAANKRRLSTTSGSRGVTSLTPEQLNKKRANDREAQRAIRERTKNQIETLERRVLELTSQQPYQELQAVIRQKEAIQAENDEIRRRLSSALAILQPILNTQSTNGKAPPPRHGSLYEHSGLKSPQAPYFPHNPLSTMHIFHVWVQTPCSIRLSIEVATTRFLDRPSPLPFPQSQCHPHLDQS